MALEPNPGVRAHDDRVVANNEPRGCRVARPLDFAWRRQQDFP